MIKLDTICYLTNGHARAGQCCIVTGPLARYPCEQFRGGFTWAYLVTLASGEKPDPGFTHWGAAPDQLIPIAPPDALEECARCAGRLFVDGVPVADVSALKW